MLHSMSTLKPRSSMIRRTWGFSILSVERRAPVDWTDTPRYSTAEYANLNTKSLSATIAAELKRLTRQ